MRIYLCGFMGSGKSGFGKKLARALNTEFLDLDEAIESKVQLSIPEIFEKKGEQFFREVEHECLFDTVYKDDLVVSLGGGTCCSEENMDFILKNGISIYLKVEEDILYGRLKGNKSNRPLIKDLDDQELREFISVKLAERLPFYERCIFSYEKDGTSFEFLIRQIAAYMR